MALNGMYVDFKSYCKKLKSTCKMCYQSVHKRKSMGGFITLTSDFSSQ